MEGKCTEHLCTRPGHYVVQDGAGPDTQRRVCKRHAEALSHKTTVRTSSKAFVDELYAEESATHLVSIGAPGDDLPACFDPDDSRHLRLEFDDVSHDAESVTARFGYVPPSAEHIQKLVSWTRLQCREKVVLVHCAAGISRSTACAAVVLMAANEMSEGDAVAAVKRNTHKRGIARPNQLILRLARKVLGADATGSIDEETTMFEAAKPDALATITPRLLDVVAGLRNQYRQYDVPDNSVTPAHLLLLKAELAAHIDELSQLAQIAVLAVNLEQPTPTKRLWCTSGHCTSPVVYVDADGRHWCEGCGDEWGNEIERIDQ